MFAREVDTRIDNLTEWEGMTNNSTKNCVLADEDEPDYRYLELTK
jgi:hypothetical protein